jgi:hypothetical protein
MTVKCKCPLGDLIWKIKVFYSIDINRDSHIYRGLAVVVQGKGANLCMVAKQQQSIVQLTKGSFFVFVDSFEKLHPRLFRTSWFTHT